MKAQAVYWLVIVHWKCSKWPCRVLKFCIYHQRHWPSGKLAKFAKVVSFHIQFELFPVTNQKRRAHSNAIHIEQYIDFDKIHLRGGGEFSEVSKSLAGLRSATWTSNIGVTKMSTLHYYYYHLEIFFHCNCRGWYVHPDEFLCYAHGLSWAAKFRSIAIPAVHRFFIPLSTIQSHIHDPVHLRLVYRLVLRWELPASCTQRIDDRLSGNLTESLW